MTVFLAADANRLASNEEQTCTSTGGLAALGGAAPDTNRAAGLHSHFVVPMAHSQSVELACYRSDLLKASPTSRLARKGFGGHRAVPRIVLLRSCNG